MRSEEKKRERHRLIHVSVKFPKSVGSFTFSGHDSGNVGRDSGNVGRDSGNLGLFSGSYYQTGTRN